jgi:hypothetical protein
MEHQNYVKEKAKTETMKKLACRDVILTAAHTG